MEILNNREAPPKVAADKTRIVIIGAGFGGLSAGIRLQAAGYQVTIIEKSPRVGGHAAQFKRDGYTFDMGPSLITAPSIIRDIFAQAGQVLEDEVDLIPLDPFYRIFYADGSKLDYTGNPESMRSQLAQFDQRDAAGYDRYMDDTRGIYNAVIRDGLGQIPFMDIKTLLDFLPQALKLKALQPAYKYASRYFHDERSRFAFSFHPLFLGGNPFRAPSVYQMIPYLEREEGVWFTRGGMYSLVQAFERVFRNIGGEVVNDCEVQRIAMFQGKANGVMTDSGFIPADAVVSNADWKYTMLELVDPAHRPMWMKPLINSRKTSMGVYLLYLGVRKQYPNLLHHTLILSHRYKELVRDIFDRHVLPDDFSMYLHAPTRTDPSMAPAGGESLYVLIPVANQLSGIDWNERVVPFTEKVIDFLEEFGLDGLRENIDVQETFTPDDFARVRNSYLGSAWGLEPRLSQTATFRPHNRSNLIPNLYFVGAGTHPGAGLPGVMLSAAATTGLINKDLPVNAAMKGITT